MAILFYIFYQSVWLSASVLPLGIVFVRPYKRMLCERRRRRFCVQFKDMLYFVSASLSAGQTVERAFLQAQEDLLLHYPADADIINEMRRINNEVALHIPLENSLASLAKRTHIEDVQIFAQVFTVCHRVGGSTAEVVRTSGHMIADKMETKEEIDTILTEKKTEAGVVVLAPVVGIVTLDLLSKEYMMPLFTTVEGRVVMTIVLVLTCVASVMARKMVRIEV